MSKPKLVESKHQTALAARRIRDKKARDQLDDGYLIKLIRKSMPEFGREFTKENQMLVEAKRMVVFAKGLALGTETPEREAARKAFTKSLKQKLKRTAKGEY
ncbi:MAG TPA: hypothetical protein PLC97_11125 [Myxococcota bacterium]|nr:hypothetical protein [Myxococcota bacterium]